MNRIPVYLLAGLICATFAAPLRAQRDFLTNDEVERVKEAQEPNARLTLYVLFARQRMDQLQQLITKNKKGRSLELRELLDDYSRIIEAIDNVSDDALKRHVALTEGSGAVSTAEKRFLGQLEKVRDSGPADLGMYEVALKEAIAATSDSMELNQGDVGKRAEELTAGDQARRKKTEDMLAAEDSKGKVTQAAHPTVAADGSLPGDQTTPDGKPKRKPPTLLRPGEKAPGSPPQ